MKYAWMLALPYFVASTIGPHGSEWAVMSEKSTVQYCGEDQGYCEDIAQALNDAHEKRHDAMRKRSMKVIPNSGRVYAPHETHEINFNYDQACHGSCAEDK